MRIGFAGTPTFAATALESILDAGLPVKLVLTQPDRPHGRGLKQTAGAVKALALARALPLRQPASLKSEPEWAPLVALPLDVLVVAAYGLIVPPAMLTWPRHGCLNIHASLLPRWRGAAPIARAILAGDRQTGVSIMRMDEGLDTGPVVARHALAIDPRETAGSLHDKLAALGARAIVDTLRRLARGEGLQAVPQDASGATYAAKLQRHEADIDWSADAQAIDRAVRAFDPAPGAQTTLERVPLKIWEAEPVAGRFGTPGSVVRADANGILVACGEGALLILKLQRAGGKRMEASAFLAGHDITVGSHLGSCAG
ncbi:MAG TPA: methionyl-tRNA formyltransferase [Casimicrobiaceae bacterium]|nr:methionyl-tRNA formyltransferase [Casimicrobiaceae bacterium]